MSECMVAKRMIEEEVQSPVEQFLTSAEQFCEEIREWFEEQAEQSVAVLEQQTQRICQSWPWPLNWLCNAVTTLVLVIIKVVVKVVKWVAYTVCKTVTIVTRIVVTVIVRVVKYLAVLVCALGKGEWLEAAHALGGLYTSLVDAVEDITRDSIRLLADVTKGVTRDVIEIVADVVGAGLSAICMFPALKPDEQGACRQGVENFFLGVAKLADAFADVLTSVVDGLALIGSGIARGFDTQKIGEGVVKVLYGGVFGFVHSLRSATFMWAVDGIREIAQSADLIKCVGNLIEELVPKGTRGQMRQALGLDVGMVRLRWPVTVTQFYLDSQASDPSVNPRALHPTFINLYDLVGGFNIQWPPPFGRPRNEMVIAGTRQRPTRDDIDRYLSAKRPTDTAVFDPREVSRFRIYPMSRETLDLHIQTAVEKAREIGLHLVFTVREQPAAEWFDARVSTVADPALGFGINLLLSTSLGRTGAASDLCLVVAGALVRDDPVLDPGIFGSTNFSPVSTPLSGLEYRDAWPDFVFKYVLVHEIGHYFGLDHPGHTGANHIMWSIGSGIAPVSGDTVAEAFMSAEPRFSLQDGCAVWRWILTNASSCIALPSPRPPSG